MWGAKIKITGLPDSRTTTTTYCISASTVIKLIIHFPVKFSKTCSFLQIIRRAWDYFLLDALDSSVRRDTWPNVSVKK